MKKFSVIFLLILLLAVSSGCQTSPETQEPPTATLTAATLAPTATLEPSPTATEKPMTLQEKVDAFAAGRIEFPTDMSTEEYSAFIDEMNNYVGRQAIWVETYKNKDNSPVVLYFDVAKSKMVALPGTYEDNKETIDKNQLEMFVKISEEAETGNMQYVNSSGELVTSPDSADVNWGLQVNGNNYQDGLIDLPKILSTNKTITQDWLDSWWSRGFDQNNLTLVPAILIDNKVSRVVAFQGGWNEYPCLNMLFIVTNEQGEPLYGIRKMVGPDPRTRLGFEGDTLNLDASFNLRDSDAIKKFEAGAVYYVGIMDQQKTWDDYNKKSINDLQGTASAPATYDETFNEYFPEDGNIILAGGTFIKKK